MFGFIILLLLFRFSAKDKFQFELGMDKISFAKLFPFFMILNSLYQELKHDFSCYLMNVRILAKFLGFLLFQPYHGAETTSQVIRTETLEIRNRVSHPITVK